MLLGEGQWQAGREGGRKVGRMCGSSIESQGVGERHVEWKRFRGSREGRREDVRGKTERQGGTTSWRDRGEGHRGKQGR